MAARDELPAQFGRYRILRQLGVGGMGTVYLAEDTHLRRRVALKVPHFDADDGPQPLQRFLREARSVAGIKHEHVCLVHDLGEIDGIPYLTMEYVEGTSLTHQIEQSQPYPPRRAVELLCKLARAVHVLHTHDVIHRDLKPGNILLRPSGEPVLLDFGLARLRSPQSQQLTVTGTLLGTLAYMSPEQVRTEKEIGPATDVYSLGVILYELLTGERPFPGPSEGELAGQILYGKLEPPSQLRAGLDGALDTLCLRAMARKVAERFTTAEELATALTTYLQPRGAALARTPSVPVPEKKPGQATPPEEKPAPKPAPDRITVDLGAGVPMTLVRIPAAGRKFWMGSPTTEADRNPFETVFDAEQQVEVEFSRDFWMAIHETTQAQYVAITTQANPSWFAAAGKGKTSVAGLETRNFPVEMVSWEDCDACVKDLNRRFAAELAKKVGTRVCVFGLPTEAQWEYACRGGATEKASLPFHLKDGPTAALSSTQAEINGKFRYGTPDKGQSLGHTTTVGSYEPNRFGLFDLHGNVWEWCADYYGPLPGGRDPERTAPHNKQDRRIVRGGSWFDDGRFCRAALRNGGGPGHRNFMIGFRVVVRLDW